MKPLLEICIDSVESALKAEKAGADRLELCENLIQGGVTPSLAKIEAVISAVSIPIHVLIRPRAGDFVYASVELDIIYRDIEHIANTSCAGLVVGALNSGGNIPEEFLEHCNAKSKNKTLVFHRAFDLTKNASSSAELLIKHGFNTVLTSGQKNSAVAGTKVLASLQHEFSSELNILAGGGVRSENIKDIHKLTGIKQYHSSAKILIDKGMPVSMSSSLVAEHLFTVDEKEIIEMKNNIDRL